MVGSVVKVSFGCTTSSAPRRSASLLCRSCLATQIRRPTRVSFFSAATTKRPTGRRRGRAPSPWGPARSRAPRGPRRRGLYRGGGLVRQVVGDPVELGGVGDERALGPAPAGVAAEAGLDASEMSPFATFTHRACGPRRSRRRAALRRAPRSRGPAPGRPARRAESSPVFGHDAHDLVTEDEGRGGDRGESRASSRASPRSEPQMPETRGLRRTQSASGALARDLLQFQGREPARLETTDALRTGAHEQVAWHGLAVAEGQHPRPCLGLSRSCSTCGAASPGPWPPRRACGRD